MKKKYISPQTYVYNVSPLFSIAQGLIPTGSGDEHGVDEPAAKGTGSHMWDHMNDDDED